MDRRKFIALPKGNFELTPKLWIALGLIAYNYHLMTLQPLQVIATAHNFPNVPRTRLETADRGRAVMLSTEGLSPATRAAISEIARTLLLPLGLTISNHGGSPVPGCGRTARYLLVEEVGASDCYDVPELGPQVEPGKAIA